MKNLEMLGYISILAVVIFGGIYFEWWRCGEMFPNAQLACMLSGR